MKIRTQRTLHKIEVALAKSDSFNYIRNIVAFNVNGISESLGIWHECDMLVLSKSGYLTEIEIKRSWPDFIADFKNNHKHESNSIIKYFYYCIPECLLEEAYEKLIELEVQYTGIITYNEDLVLSFHGHKSVFIDGSITYPFVTQHPHRKLFLEEQLQVARFGAMRAVKLKEELITAKQLYEKDN